MQRLSGQIALITGGSRGFGRATALRLAREGADVVVCYRSAEREAQDVVDQVVSLGRRGLAIQADIGDQEAARRMVGRALDAFGRIDVLVNNAGIRHIAPFAKQDPAAWEDTIATNLRGTLTTTHATLPSMIEHRRGRVIILSSQMAHVGWENFAVYAGTKAFLLAFTKSLAREVGPYGITVNAVCPGSIVTDMNRENYGPKQQAERAATLPLRRMGDPDDVAGAVLYLASDDGGFITGQCIDVNGGATMA